MADDHPHIEVYWRVVPVWHTESYDELENTIGEGYCCGFASGFERGVVMAMLRPEWAQGFYGWLRTYYLRTHAEDDLKAWDEHAGPPARGRFAEL